MTGGVAYFSSTGPSLPYGHRIFPFRPASLGAGGGDDRRQDPLVRAFGRLRAGQCHRVGAPARAQRHSGARGDLCAGGHILQLPGPGFSRPLSAVDLAHGSVVHRPPLLLSRRTGEPIPLLLLLVVGVLRHTALDASHLRHLCVALCQLQPLIRGAARRPRQSSGVAAEPGRPGLGDVGVERYGLAPQAGG